MVWGAMRYTRMALVRKSWRKSASVAPAAPSGRRRIQTAGHLDVPKPPSELLKVGPAAGAAASATWVAVALL